MATTKGRVRVVDITDISTAETDINAVLEAEEANGFVLRNADIEVVQDDIGGLERHCVLDLIHQDYAPGGTGSGGAPLKKIEVNITQADLTDAALAQEIAIPSPPANGLFLGGEVEVKTIAAAPGLGAATASIGDTGDPDEYVTDQNLLTTGHKSVAGAKLASGPALEASYVPVVRVVGDVNVDTFTALDMWARLYYIDLPDTP